MYTGRMIEELMNAVQRAEEHVRRDPVELPPSRKMPALPAFLFDMRYTEPRIGVA